MKYRTVMNTKKTRLLSILFAFVMSMTGVDAFAHAIEVTNNDGVTIYYNFINNKTELAVTYFGTNKKSAIYSGNVVIPESVTYDGNTYSVTRIGNYAFNNCSSLTSVTIPNSVTVIGLDAFAFCSSLTSVTIPANVTNIASDAFYSCSSLTSVIIPNSVTTIGSDAFRFCSDLTSIAIPNSVTSIGMAAFDGTGWYNAQDDGLVYLNNVLLGYKGNTPQGRISIKQGTRLIAERALSDCPLLTSVTIPNSVTSIGSGAFRDCNSIESVTIPYSVTFIGDQAFQYCRSLRTVTVEIETPIAITKTTFGIYGYADNLFVPAGCKAAYEAAQYWQDFTNIVEMEAVSPSIIFADANVKALCVQNWDTNGDGELSEAEAAAVTDLGEVFKENTTITSFDELQYFTGLTNIGYQAFRDCSGLTSVTISNSVTSIGETAFYGCSGLTSVAIPNTVTSIGSNAFSDCGLTSVTIPSSVTFIDEFAFTYCSNLTSIIVEGGNINYDSRDNCNAIIETNSNTLIAGCKNTIIPNSVTSIGDYAFEGCSGLTSVTIPNSVTSIGTAAFSDCSLTSVTIPSSVTSIGGSAFRYCNRLTSVTIPNSVNTIGQMAFSGCSYLQRVKISDLAAWCNIAFEDEDANPLTYAHHLYDEYGEITYLDIPDNVTSIGEYAFSGCIGLTGLTIPSSVTSIGEYAFSGCSNLTSVTVEMETPLTITELTFNNRANATLYVPAGCKAAYEAANYWKEFKKIVEPSPAITFANANVKALCVQNWDTDGDGELSEAEAAAVTDLGEVFKENTTITSFDELQYFTGLTNIGEEAFYNCTGMTSMAIPNTVTTIGKRAFKSCSGLTSVTIPESVTNIGYASFHNCDNLASLTIPNSVTSVGVAAFATCNKLTSIIVENGNSSFTSEDGVLFNKDKTSLICFPAGKTQSTYTIPESVTRISSYAFDSCNKLTSVDIPNSVTSIGEWVFSACSGLTSVTIPNSVTSIGNHAFWRCTSLASVTIPNSVTTIGGGAFGYCSTLTSVKVGMESPLTIDSETFTNRANTTLYIPKGCKSAYQAADYWKEFKAIKEFPDSDVNQDGEIDMMDVVDIARFVVGTPAETFVEFLADLNNNGEVNVADAVVLVNEIVGDQNFAKAFGAPRQDQGDDRLTLTKNDEHSLSFSMESQRDYTAFQFDLYTNSEDDVMGLRLNTARKHGHQLIYNNVDEGHYRVVALSVANNTFNGNNGELLNIQLDGFNAADMTISNIHFITTDGTDYRFDDLRMSGATGIESLTPNPSPKEEGNVYDLSGRKVSESSVLPKGVYIMNGKKVIVK